MSRIYTKGYGVFVLCWSLLIGSQALAQGGDIVFQKVNDGLSQNTVAAIVQDELGFIWFGTRYGLNSFDGVEFINYRNAKDDKTSIKNEAIESLLYDGRGKIWIGTYGGGINLFDIYTKEFSKPDEKLKGAGQYIMEIYQDANGKIWIGSFNSGLSYYDPDSDEFYNFLADDPTHSLLPYETIPAIGEDSQGNLWVGTGGNGLKLVRKGSGKPGSAGFLQPESYLEDKYIRCLHKGKSGRLWVGANDGIREMTVHRNEFVFSFEPYQKDEKYQALANSTVLSVLETNNKVWIGTENKGLYLLNLSDQTLKLYKKNDKSLNVESNLNGNSIWALFEDRDGTVWISSYLRGLNKVDPSIQRFKTVKQAVVQEKTIQLDLISSFAEDDSGNLWIGSDGSGLFYFDQKNGRFLQHFDLSTMGNLLSNEVVSLLYDRQGNLWVGTWEGGLNILYKGQKEFVQLLSTPQSTNNICGKNIHALYQDSKDRIWIAAFSNGLDCYDPVTGIFTHFKKGPNQNDLLSNNIRAIAEDKKGNIWLGMEANGVQLITLDDNLKITATKNLLAKKQDQIHHGSRINSIYLDDLGQVWLSTSGEGLYQYLPDKDSVLQYTMVDGLPSDMVYAAGIDDIGNLWGSTNKGLFCMNLSDKSVKTFTIGDGLQSNEFYKKSFYKSKSGELFFGGINGFNQFDAKNVLGDKNNKPPAIYITGIITSNEEETASGSNQLKGIFNGKELALKHWQNDLTFQFAATNYIQAEKNSYRFKLENYDKDWRENGSGRVAYYTNIPPGNYRFQVLASNNDGVWNEEGATFSIHIANPWYATPVAYLLYGLLVVGALVWARNNIIARERLKSQLEMEHVELMKIQELGKMKSQFFANISHEFKTPLTLIMTPIRALMDVNPLSPNSKHYQIILNNSERLLKLVNQIMDLSKLESGNIKLKATEQDLVVFLKEITMNFSGYADQHHMDYELVFPNKKIPLFFDKEKMEKVFVNLLSNAFKFTQKYGMVSLRVKEEKDTVDIFIEDNGKGIPPEERQYVFDRFFKSNNSDNSLSTGIGLSLTKQLVELHHGAITFTSEMDKGTCFVVSLKKGDAHLEQDQIIKLAMPFEYSPESLISMNEFREKGLASTGVATKEQEKPRVLVVEDNDELRAFITGFLEPKYEIIEASNGIEGLKKAIDHMPDILVTDVTMPGMDGFELTKQLKEGKLTSHILVIMLTVKSSDESKEEGLRLGVNHYLTKPFNPAHLEMLIQNMLRSRQQYKSQLMNRQAVKLAPKEEEPIPYSELDEQFLNSLIQAIEANMKDPDFKIDDLCRKMGFSKSQLYRKLKSLVGQSANEFIRSIRLKKAAQLLRQRRNLKVSEITYMVGFNDLHYFRDCFKKQYGMSPTSYLRHIDKDRV
jgi:signal transduction histidine kinase/ligand-binding sensor domain-containing protein/CheY-like chemotaxis protein